MKRYLSLSLLFCGLMAVVAQAGEYKDADTGITFSYPDSFEKAQQPGTAVVLMTPTEEGDTFRENINLVIEPLKGEKLSAKEYAEAARKGIKTMMPSSTMGELTPTKLGGQDAYEHTVELTAGEVKIKMKQVITVHNGNGVVMTFTGTPTTLDKLLKDASEILTSLKLN